MQAFLGRLAKATGTWTAPASTADWMDAYGSVMAEEMAPSDLLDRALAECSSAAEAASAFVGHARALSVQWRHEMARAETEMLDRRAAALRDTETLLMACRGVRTLFDRHLLSAAREADDRRIAVLAGFCDRAIETAAEVLTLLRFGHAAGALARWRQLREVEVLSLFIASQPASVAAEYEQHAAYRGLQLRFDYQRWARSLGEEPLRHSELRAIDGVVEAVRADRLHWESDYGWAHEALLRTEHRYRDLCAKGRRARGPTFRDLEHAVGSSDQHLFYGLASEQVHLAESLFRDDPDGWSRNDALDTIAGEFVRTMWVPTAALVLSWPRPETPDGAMSQRAAFLEAMAQLVATGWEGQSPAGGR